MELTAATSFRKCTVPQYGNGPVHSRRTARVHRRFRTHLVSVTLRLSGSYVYVYTRCVGDPHSPVYSHPAVERAGERVLGSTPLAPWGASGPVIFRFRDQSTTGNP